MAENCEWCGKRLHRKHNATKYCSNRCREEATREKNRKRQKRWYDKNKDVLSEKKRYGLGSGWISNKANADFNKEKKIISNEMKRLRIR